VADVSSSDGLISPPALVPSSPIHRRGARTRGVLRLVCAIGLAALAITPTAAGSGADDGNSPDGTVRVTAVVTDRRGQLVRNLKPVDFELLEDGKPQTLEGAEYVARAPAGPRTIAFLLDEFHTAPADSASVRDSLLRFVDTRLRPGDSAVVVKPLDPLTAIKSTDDREAIRRAIASFEGRKGDYTPKTVFERNYMAQAPEAVRWARAQIVTSALRAIGAVLTQSGKGQAAIVIVSDGFERSRSSREVPANLQSVVRVINKADAAVYAFTPSPPVAETDGTQDGEDGGVQALRRLAKDTGGDLFAGQAAFEAGFTRLAGDLDAHYVLTYRATHGNDGRFHALQVGVKRPDTTVRARSGYVAALSETVRASLTPRSTAPLRVLRRSSLIQSWSGLTPTGDGADVLLTWAPVSLATSARTRAASVVVTASAADGAVLFDGAIAPVGEARGASLPDFASFAAPVGAVRIDMKILDGKGVVLDTDARDVSIPKPRRDAATLYSPSVLRVRSAREFRDLASDKSAAPTPLREFRRTERLILRVAAIDAAGAPTDVRATLLNRWRQPMRDLEPMPERWDSITQFDLPLSGLAPGEYTVRISLSGPTGNVAEHVTFKVQG
jgi:VWFA-related protein